MQMKDYQRRLRVILGLRVAQPTCNPLSTKDSIFPRLSRVALVGLAVALDPLAVRAHCVVGARFFPATLSVDDPCVAEELSLPTVASFKNGDDPSAKELDISAEYSKRITDTIGVSIGSAWTRIRPPDAPSVSGYQNLEASFKWQYLTLPAREFVTSAALEVEFGHTGNARVDADPFTTFTPTLFVGQGLGVLPDDMRMARPFAVTGQIGYSVPSSSSSTTVDPDSGEPMTELHPRFLTYGGSLQYSMPYLKANVVDLGLPEFFDHLIPIVEAQFQTPVANYSNTGIGTTGTVTPGLIWVGRYFQVGVEAIIPINRASGTGVGVLAQLHLYLDDIFPNSIGKPIFSSATTATSTLGR
jgi:hypothetical protein